MESLDSALVVFKSEDIYSIQGQGPDDTGANTTYGNPSSIQSNVGCVEAESVVRCPLGIFFRGRRGLYLLDRSLQVKYVGKPIEEALASVTITDAIYWEKDSQVRFFTSAGVFVYDLINESWSTFTYPVTLVKACTVNSELYMIDSDQDLYRESGYLDNGAFVSMSFQTAYFRPQQGLRQAWQRFRRVSLQGLETTPVNVTVTLMRDYIDSVTDPRSWTDAEIAATYRPSNPQLQIHPTVQKMQALSVKFQDSAPTTASMGTGQGWRLQSISCKVAAARGEAKIPSANNK